jgi:hypothetical protein
MTRIERRIGWELTEYEPYTRSAITEEPAFARMTARELEANGGAS